MNCQAAFMSHPVNLSTSTLIQPPYLSSYAKSFKMLSLAREGYSAARYPVYPAFYPSGSNHPPNMEASIKWRAMSCFRSYRFLLKSQLQIIRSFTSLSTKNHLCSRALRNYSRILLLLIAICPTASSP